MRGQDLESKEVSITFLVAVTERLNITGLNKIKMYFSHVEVWISGLR